MIRTIDLNTGTETSRQPTAQELLDLASQPQADPKDAIRAEIKRLETEQLMPRGTREFMLLFMESSFTAPQLALNIGYVNMKAFDNQIKVLRDQL